MKKRSLTNYSWLKLRSNEPEIKKYFIVLFFALAPAFILPLNIFAQVNLDNSFGNGGIVITTTAPYSSEINAIACQADGKIVAVGSGDKMGGISGYHFQVARYNADGTLDNSFGNGGILFTNIAGQDAASSVVIQTDGKIVVGGNITFPSYCSVIVRYNNNGTLDNTFGTGGIVSTSVNPSQAWLSSVVLQSDGKIVAGGYAGNQFMVIRYNNDGTLDNSFGSGGIALNSLEGNSYIWSILIQPDGKIVSAGSTNSKFAIVRYNTDGTLDNSFGVGGQLIASIGPLSSDACSNIALQPDGKIVAAGFSQTNLQTGYFILARINPDGSFDNSFGNNGIIETNTYPLATDLVLQTNGKIIVSGCRNIGFGYDFSLNRFNADGTVDMGFGNSGSIIVDIGSGNDYAQCMTSQSDQKIIVAGSSRTSTVAPSYPADFTLARFTTDAVGIAEETKPFYDIKTYPNPACETIQIEIPKDVNIKTITLHDMQGKLISSFSSADTTLDINEISKGNYLIRIITDKGIYTENLIKN